MAKEMAIDEAVAEGLMNDAAAIDPEIAMQRDEEFARSLQALDNGLRRRKRSSVSLFGEQILSAPGTKTTPQRKQRRVSKGQSNGTASPRRRSSTSSDTSSRRGSGDSGTPKSAKASRRPSSLALSASARSPLTPSPNKGAGGPAKGDSRHNFCQGCGKMLSRSPTPDREHVVQSKENLYNCATCVVLYSLPPSPDKLPTMDKIQASPAFRCLQGCKMTFLFLRELEDHKRRIHGPTATSATKP